MSPRTLNYAERLARAQRAVQIAERELERAREERAKEMARAALAGNNLRQIAAWTGIDLAHVSRQIKRAGITVPARTRTVPPPT